MERRHLINGGLVSGFAALAAPVSATLEPAAPQGQNRDDREVAQAIDNLNDALQRSAAVSPELARIREQQRIFLKANQKFPDFMDVGIGIWENVYDWHVRHQQPIAIARTGDGRYTMAAVLTTLVLRPDQSDTYVGFGFDAR